MEASEAPVETVKAPVETVEAPVETPKAPVETPKAPVETTKAVGGGGGVVYSPPVAGVRGRVPPGGHTSGPFW